MFENVDMRRVLGRSAEKDDGDDRELDGEEERGADEGLVQKAEEILDVIDPYGAPGPEKEPDEDDTPIQRQQRLIDRRASLERRRAKAELLADVLEAFVEACQGGASE